MRPRDHPSLTLFATLSKTITITLAPALAHVGAAPVLSQRHSCCCQGCGLGLCSDAYYKAQEFRVVGLGMKLAVMAAVV